jgi:hypothetical protein
MLEYQNAPQVSTHEIRGTTNVIKHPNYSFNYMLNIQELDVCPS